MKHLDRQADFLLDANRMRRRNILVDILKTYENELTIDTQIVLAKIMGRIPLGGTYYNKYVELLGKSKVPDMDEALVFQLRTFIDEEMVYTLTASDNLPDLKDLLLYLVKSFNHQINFDDSLHMTVPCYIPAVKCTIHYGALIKFTKYGKQMQSLLEYDVWRSYLYTPKNYAQTAFVRLMLGKYFIYWDEFSDNVRNLDLNCSNVTEMLNAIGISKSRLIHDTMPDTELTVNQWIPHIRWDEKWGEHGEPELKVRSVLNYFSEHTTLTKAQRLDLAVWIYQYPTWFEEFTYFECNVGTDEVPDISKIRIHNHNVLDHLTLPKINGKVNLKIHPKDWVQDNVSESLMNLIKKTNMFCTKPFPIDRHLVKRLQDQYPNQEVRFLSTPNQLIEEGEQMTNCVGGIRYVTGSANGDFHIYHLNNSSVDSHGLTLMVNANPRKGVVGLVCEVKGYDNREIDEAESKIIADFIAAIYLPDWTFKDAYRLTNVNYYN